MKKIFTISIISILTIFSCTKEDVIKVLNNDFEIVDERSSKKTNGIDVYADLKKENENYISLQTNSTNYLCGNNIIPLPLLTASFRKVDVDVKGFRISGNEFLLNDKNGFYLPPSKNTKMVNLFNTNSTVEVFDESDKVIGSMKYHITNSFCPNSSESYNQELKRFEIKEGGDLDIAWNADEFNDFGLAFGLADDRIMTSTRDAFIKIVDDNGFVSISYSDLKDYRTLTIGSFAENIITLTNGDKISVVTMHYSVFPIVVL